MLKKKDYIIFLLRILMGSTFLFSALLKLSNINFFMVNLETYNIMPLEIIPFFAFGICIAELTLGIFAILNINIKITYNLIICILLLFTGFVLFSIFKEKEWSCGCFGSIFESKITYLTLLRNIILIIIAIILRINNTQLFSYNNFTKVRVINTIVSIFIISTIIITINIFILNKRKDINVGDSLKEFAYKNFSDKMKIMEKDEYYLLCLFSLNDCVSCLNETKLWQEIYSKYRGKINVIGICNNANPIKLQAFIKHRGIQFKVINDKDGIMFDKYMILTPVKILLNSKYEVVLKEKSTGIIEDQIKFDFKLKKIIKENVIY